MTIQDFVAWRVLAKLFERNKLKVALKRWRQQKTGVRVLKGCACAAYVNAPNGRGDCRRRADSARQH